MISPTPPQRSLIQTFKRPINILATKLRNVVRRVRWRLGEKPYIVSSTTRNLRNETVSFTLNNPVRSEVYCIHGSQMTFDNHCECPTFTVSIFFYDRDGNELPDDTSVGLPYLQNLGFHRHIVGTSFVSNFRVYFSPRHDSKSLKIELRSLGNDQTNICLMSDVLLERLKLRDKTYAKILNLLDEEFRDHTQLSEVSLQTLIRKYCSNFEKEPEHFINIVGRHLQTINPPMARYFVRRILDANPTEPYARKAYFFFNRSGSIIDRVNLQKDLESRNLFNDELTKMKSNEELLLLKGGFPLPPKARICAYTPQNNVLYLLHNSLPYNSGGYATRTHGLISGVTNHSEFTVRGLSRPGYPTDHKKHISKKLPDSIPEVHTFQDIDYLTGPQGIYRSRMSLQQYVQIFSDDIIKKAASFQPRIIHAASNYPNGLAAILAARHLGIKSVYEVRGLWELTKASRLHYWKHSDKFALDAKLEAQALQSADAAITITNALKSIMQSRGVTKEIHVVPNAVNVDLFTPNDQRDQELAFTLGIQDEAIIGYVGSIVDYEGLDDLLSACKTLSSQKVNYKLLIVGDGAALTRLKELCSKFGLGKQVIFTGRVPFEEVPRYLSLIDIMPFPRKPLMVCEAVSPLKPFESMASKKPILVSSCAALEEIVIHGKTGLVFKKADIDDLAKKLHLLIENKNLRNTLAENGYKWVHENRTWEKVSKTVSDIYENL